MLDVENLRAGPPNILPAAKDFGASRLARDVDGITTRWEEVRAAP